MDINAVILKALNRSEGLPNEQRARVIADFIDIASDLTGVSPAPAQRPAPAFTRPPLASTEVAAADYSNQVASNIIILPGQESEPPSRFSSVTLRSTDECVRSVKELSQLIQREAQNQIEVDLGDGGKPLVLRRKIEQVNSSQFSDGGSNDEGIVRLKYALGGEEDCPVVVFSTGDRVVDVSKKVSEVKEAVKSRYSRTERSPLKPRPAPSMRFDLDDIMRNSRGGDADEAQGSDAVARMAPLPANARVF